MVASRRCDSTAILARYVAVCPAKSALSSLMVSSRVCCRVPRKRSSDASSSSTRNDAQEMYK